MLVLYPKLHPINQAVRSALGTLLGLAFVLSSFGSFAQNAPNAVNDFSSGNEDSPQSINIIANDSDPDGTVLGNWVSITSGPNNGQMVYDLSTGLLSYIPATNYFGNDTIWYTICDGGSPNLCDNAYAVFVVNPVNDRPFLVGDTISALEEVAVTFNTMDNDTDIDGNINYTTFAVLSGPFHGSYTVDPVTGDITYTPNMDYNGVDSLIYTVCDNGLPVLCDTAVAYIVVDFVNDAPVAVDDYATCLEDGDLDISILANDSDIDGWLVVQTYHLIVQSQNAQIIWNASNQMFNYIPNPGFFGQDTMVYMICDNGTPILCDTALIIITVEHVNHPPSAGPGIMINVNDYGSQTVNLLANASDPDPMDQLSVTVIQDPAHGTYTLNGAELTYVAEHGHCGYDEIVYVVCDDWDPSLCDTNIITIYTEPLDSDGDGLSDFWEYRDDNQDFDGDGTPDYMDLDSDNDNLTDEFESGCNNDLCEERSCDCPIEEWANEVNEWVDRTACLDFEIPNSFSPNNDGNFDTWTFDVGDQFPNSVVHIYNRWGNKLLTLNGPVFEWDGRAVEGNAVVGGSDSELPVGTYFYILDLGYDQGDKIPDPIDGYIYLNK